MAVQRKATKSKARPTAKKAPAKKKVKPVPDGYAPLIPRMALERCSEAIDFYKKVFGARERLCFYTRDGKVGHAELLFGTAVMMLGEAKPPTFPPSPGRLALYTRNVDATFNNAVAAGATSKEEPRDMVYGDRAARVIDPFGAEWVLMTHIEDVTPREMLKRMAPKAPPS
ncbi:MAG TPA: VOC family protein [Myxococcales bacterium]|nr:VOC family protein [Myxococcales bacterium]